MNGLPEQFDIDLLLASRTGDVTAFAELYRRHARAVLRYAWGRLGREDEAEEVLQETFLVAWEKLEQVPIVDESLLPYLLATCRNHMSNRLRKRRRWNLLALPDTLAAPTRNEDLAWMMGELNKLSTIDRQLCQLCLGNGVSYRDAARIVDSTETAVGKRLQRARTRLRSALGAEE
ncbi:MAG: sigma-70 family RNA polymerase sigma factor [Lacisediminihabitans sp.]